MKTQTRVVIFSFLVSLALSGCVSQKKYAELKKNYDKSESERNYMTGALKDLETERNELSGRVDKLQKDYDQAKKESAIFQGEYASLKERFLRQEDFKKQLVENQEKSSAVSRAENTKLLQDVLKAQENLQVKEDELVRKEAELRKLEAQLNGLKRELDEKDKALQEREKRINELERLMAEKDEATRALKDKVANALLNFADKGLTVTQKNGRIYVSMEAKLLFPSGSTVINPEGKSALIELGKVLEKQTDITILVEGHTDIDAMSGNGPIKDNWDLSVMRSTSVVKLMLENSKIDPKVLTAAGRSEFLPVENANTPEAKAKNRRIEVILTPNLDQLFKILDEESSKLGDAQNKEERPADLEKDSDWNKPE
ncbi:MAG: OmpA family protein [Flavobacteriales bacterium]|nr:OmpA family protein [Flavobacteriales bacterium]